jgi:hypothetical protein
MTPLLFNQINQYKESIEKSLVRGDQSTLNAGLEGLSILCGKLLLDLSQSEDAGFCQNGLSMLLSAREAMVQGKGSLENKSPYRVDPSRASKWVSFDGEIKYPLETKRSSIPNAGDGLFTNRSIKRGEVIAPSRVKVDNKGDFFSDWRKFPVAAMTNHHPIPNMDIVRADAPLGCDPSFGETCYFVANRDIQEGEELTSDYRDKGWAEYDYFESIPLPFAQWDAGALSTVSNPPSLWNTVRERPQDYALPIGITGGAAMVAASQHTKGMISPVLGLGGLIWTGYTVWKSNA